MGIQLRYLWDRGLNGNSELLISLESLQGEKNMNMNVSTALQLAFAILLLCSFIFCYKFYKKDSGVYFILSRLSIVLGIIVLCVSALFWIQYCIIFDQYNLIKEQLENPYINIEDDKIRIMNSKLYTCKKKYLNGDMETRLIFGDELLKLEYLENKK